MPALLRKAAGMPASAGGGGTASVGGSMRSRWKIVIGVVGGLVLLAGGAFTWMVAGPPEAVTIAVPGASGRRIKENGLFANYFPAQGPGKKPAILLLGGSEGGLGSELLDMAVRMQGRGATCCTSPTTMRRGRAGG